MTAMTFPDRSLGRRERILLQATNTADGPRSERLVAVASHSRRRLAYAVELMSACMMLAGYLALALLA